MSLKIGKYYGDGLTGINGIPVIQIAETLDVDYKDITNVENWMMVGGSYDYLFRREQAKIYLVSVGGFSGLTSNAEKVMASKHYLAEKADRDTVMDEDAQFKSWGSFVTQSKATRDKRWSNAKNYASYVLNPVDSFELANLTNALSASYKEYGIESNAIDGIDGLLDWIQGTSGYSANGLPSKSYWTQELEDNLVSILTNGYK